MISKKHPVANWLRLAPHEHRRTLDTVIQLRDASPDPLASGMPAAAVAWFWTEELPRLLNRPDVRQQARDYLKELASRGDALQEQIQRQSGSLLEELDCIEAEVLQLAALVGSDDS